MLGGVLSADERKESGVDQNTYRLNRQCDRCTASEAKVTFENLSKGLELKLCQHHCDEHREALTAQGFIVLDLVKA